MKFSKQIDVSLITVFGFSLVAIFSISVMSLFSCGNEAISENSRTKNFSKSESESEPESLNVAGPSSLNCDADNPHFEYDLTLDSSASFYLANSTREAASMNAQMDLLNQINVARSSCGVHRQSENPRVTDPGVLKQSSIINYPCDILSPLLTRHCAIVTLKCCNRLRSTSVLMPTPVVIPVVIPVATFTPIPAASSVLTPAPSPFPTTF